jgi:7-cyano-7-deazaguanine synthase
MDSCVTATWAGQKHDLAVLHSSYGQRTEQRELRAFHEIADRLAVAHRLHIDQRYLVAIGGSALTDHCIAVPESRELATNGPIPITYVPFRNAHFLAAAVSWAEVLGARRIYIGAVEQDSSGYPDCRSEYYRVFNSLIEIGTKPETAVEIRAPLIGLGKAEIVSRGMDLGAPLDLTWSCYQSSDEACGRCDSRVLRLRAFEKVGVPDPIAYATATHLPPHSR